MHRLILGLWGPLDPRAVIVMIRAYIDETDSHRDPEAPLILFGYGARYARLGGFDKAWGKALSKGPVPYCHAREILESDGPFSGWTNHKKVHFTNRLDRIIQRHFDFGFSTCLYREDFEFYRSGGRELNTILDSDYGVSFRVILGFMQNFVPKIFP